MTTRKMKTESATLDGRYSVSEEFAGVAQIVWVVRFCGERIGASADYSSAVDVAVLHRSDFLRGATE